MAAGGAPKKTFGGAKPRTSTHRENRTYTEMRQEPHSHRNLDHLARLRAVAASSIVNRIESTVAAAVRQRAAHFGQFRSNRAAKKARWGRGTLAIVVVLSVDGDVDEQASTQHDISTDTAAFGAGRFRKERRQRPQRQLRGGHPNQGASSVFMNGPGSHHE